VSQIVREAGLEQSMAGYPRDCIAVEPAIELHLQNEVRELGGSGRLEHVTIEDTATGEHRVLAARAMVVLIGAPSRRRAPRAQAAAALTTFTL
jgi:thioredoxin reductase (NADPH)